MICLYKSHSDALGQEISDQLTGMCAAHKVISTDKSESYLMEGAHVISGRKNILDFLAEYKTILERDRSVSGDGCYLDPVSGQVC